MHINIINHYKLDFPILIYNNNGVHTENFAKHEMEMIT